MREPVKNRRDRTVPVSEDRFETVVARGRVARRVEDLDEATIKAIQAAEVPAGFGHLNDESKSR